MTDPTEAPRPRRLRLVLLVVLAVLAVLVVAGAWVGVRALMATGELGAMVPLVDEVKSAADEHDLGKLDSLSHELGEHAQKAAGLSSDPVWRAAEVLPWAGPNLVAVRVASAELDRVSRDAVIPLVALAGDAQKRSTAGSLDLAGIARDEKPLATAAASVHAAAGRLRTIDTAALLSPLAKGVDRLSSTLDTADATLTPLSRVATVLPSLLGAEKPRTLLLVIQNSAELRTGGGITGTFIQVRAAAGSLAMTGFADSRQFPYRDAPIVPVPAALTTLYGDVVGRFVQDASIPADFDLTGRLVSAWWTSHRGAKPDAVVSIDPVVLQSLLEATGPVKLLDGSELNAGNLVQRLLIDPYMTMSSEQQTVFFAQATSALFARLFTQGLDPLAWVQALVVPVQDGRISIWSADPAEQRVLERSALGGPAARQSLAGKDAYAVYFNDNDGGKMATYLKTSLAAGSAQCRSDGKSSVSVTVTLTSTAPADADTLPTSMTGGGLWGVGAGDIGMIVSVSAPPGTFYGGVYLDGKLLTSANAVESGFPVSAAHVNLQPGETNRLEFRFVSERRAQPLLLHTPLLGQPEVGTIRPACD